jgi:RimJ/RimL family protein N-acetyltransferase
MKTLENGNLILKEMTLDDAPDMYDYAKDMRVGPYAGWSPHKSLEETRHILKSMIDSNEVWGIYLKENGKLVGTIGLHHGQYPLNDEKVHSLGFVLHPDYWGMNIMKQACDLVTQYAFNDLSLDEVYANHFDFNERSGRFMIKYGMEYVGKWYSEKNERNNHLYKLMKID